MKDQQFVQRASPTTHLLRELRKRPAEHILVINFPLNPWMAKLTARLVPGWKPEQIEVNPSQNSCPTCPVFEWNREKEDYKIIFPQTRSGGEH